jgi:hypothetical protein
VGLLEGIVKQETNILAGRAQSIDDLRYLLLPKAYN